MKRNMSRRLQALVAVVITLFVAGVVTSFLDARVVGLSLIGTSFLIPLLLIFVRLAAVHSELMTQRRNLAAFRTEIKDLLGKTASLGNSPRLAPAPTPTLDTALAAPKPVAQEPAKVQDRPAEFFLQTVGRSATPGVDESTFRTSLAQATMPNGTRESGIKHKVVAGFLAKRSTSALERFCQCVSLRRSCAVDQLEIANPDALVIDRQAFAMGQWAGAESAAGRAQFKEIVAVAMWGAKKGLPTYYLEDSTQAPDVHTENIRAKANLIFPRPQQTTAAEGAPQSPLFASLQRITETHEA